MDDVIDRFVEFLIKENCQGCEDCVSKLSVKEEMIKYGFCAPDMTVTEFVEDILQPVTPTLPTCEDYVSRQSVVDFLENHAKDFDDTKVRMVFRAVSSLVGNPDNIPSVTPNDCVSKESVIKAIDKHTFDTEYGLCLDDDITCILEELPPVTLTRPKAKWIRETLVIPLSDSTKNCVRCSCCDLHFDVGTKYCPNCGAKMEVEE